MDVLVIDGAGVNHQWADCHWVIMEGFLHVITDDDDGYGITMATFAPGWRSVEFVEE